MRHALWIGAGCLLLAVEAASAAGPAEAGAGWDHRQMRSHYRSILTVESAPAALSGSDRYDTLAHEPAATPLHQVPETLDAATQRPWEPGPPRTPRVSSGTPISPDAGRGTSSSLGSSLRYGDTPPGTSESRASSSRGASTLRSGVRSSPSR